MTNCKNCGAPLHGGKCDYCGTEYEVINLHTEPTGTFPFSKYLMSETFSKLPANITHDIYLYTYTSAGLKRDLLRRND